MTTEFNLRFVELNVMEDIVALLSNPFLPIDIEQGADRFQQVFPLPSGVHMEMVDLQK